MLKRKTLLKLNWSLLAVTVIMSLTFIIVLWLSSCVSCCGIDDIVRKEVTRQLNEQDSILAKQVQKYADTCTVNINVDLCQLDSCTKTEIKYLVSEASRENLGQYINEENNHLTSLAIIIAALVSIVGIGIPVFLNTDMKRQIEEIKKKVEEAEKTKVATEQAKVGAEAAKQDAEKANKEAEASKLFAQALAETDLDKEIELYSKVLDLDPDDADALNNRGIAYRKKGKYDQAIKNYDEAIMKNPKDAGFYYNRGYAYDEKGDYDQAIKNYDEAIRLNPNLAEAFNNLGIVYFNKGEYDQSIKNFDEAIRLNQNLAEAFNNRGNAYRHKGDYDQAIKNYDEAIRLNPNLAKAYNNRGLAYSFKNKPEFAVNDFEKAVELQPNDINKLDLEMGYVLETAIGFNESGGLENARSTVQEGLKKAEESKDKDWMRIFQKFLEELP